VAGHEQYERGSYEGLVNSTKPAGGGGTQVSCVFEYIKEKKLNLEVVVILSDGYTDFPSAPDVPVFWGITSDVVPPWGVTAKIKD
jgi:predicted metal-dependent peptidase